MTKEERLKWLKQIEKDINVCSIESTLADDMKSCAIHSAIEELEQEPCEDCISRQAAIDCLNANFTIDGKENMETVVDYINGAFKQIKALPSVTPQPFINKPCVSEGVCREDKIQVLDKIRAEIDSYCSDNRDRNDGLYIAMRIIDKYKEREDKE